MGIFVIMLYFPMRTDGNPNEYENFSITLYYRNLFKLTSNLIVYAGYCAMRG